MKFIFELSIFLLGLVLIIVGLTIFIMSFYYGDNQEKTFENNYSHLDSYLKMNPNLTNPNYIFHCNSNSNVTFEIDYGNYSLNYTFKKICEKLKNER